MRTDLSNQKRSVLTALRELLMSLILRNTTKGKKSKPSCRNEMILVVETNMSAC